MTRFVFVHGAWHGGWCWEEILPMLRAQGHEVIAPDLPGMGPRRDGGPAPTLESWASFIATLAREGGGRSILVGHSRGGLVISRAAELAPEAIALNVYVAAVLAGPGETLSEAVSHGRTEPIAIRQGIEFDAKRRTSRLTSFDTAREMLYQDCPESTARTAFDRLTDEPVDVMATPVELTPERYGVVPRIYVECLKDVALPIAVQRAMCARQSCDVASLDADHSPFYSAPEQLARILLAIA